jgi:hypothetical protein
LFSFLQNTEEPKKDGAFSNALFGNTQEATQQQEENAENPLDNKLAEADKSKSQGNYKYEEVYKKLFERNIKIIKTQYLPKCNLGCV